MSSHAASSPPVLILCAQIAALALTRRLGRAGVRVGLFDSLDTAPVAFRSRYAWRCFPQPPGNEFARDSEEATLAAIEAAAAVLDPGAARPALLATSDAMVLLISRHRERLRARFRLLLPEHATLVKLLDKRTLHPLAAANGVAVPRSVVVAGEGDLRAAAAELGFPLLLKSAYGTGARGGARLTGKVRVGDEDELMAAYRRRATAGSHWLLQEYLDGGAENVALYNAYFNADSVPVAVFTGRKIRQYPVEFGTASMSAACPMPGLAAPLTAFLQALRFRGPVDIGLKWDARARVHKLLDVNPRLGQNYRTFVAPTGEDLGWLAYRELAGERFEATWRRSEQSGRPFGPKPQAAWGPPKMLPASEARRQATNTGAPSAPARWGGSGSDQAKSGEPLPAAWTGAGSRVTPLAAVPRRWKMEAQDFRSCLELHRGGRLSLAAWWREWRAWRRQAHERALVSWRDPRPGWRQWRRQRPPSPPPVPAVEAAPPAALAAANSRGLTRRPS